MEDLCSCVLDACMLAHYRQLTCVFVCACVCIKGKEGGKEGEREREREN